MWQYNFISEVNLLQKHIANGDEVFFLECNESLLACECNKNHELYHCLRCIGIRQGALELIEGGNLGKILLGKSNDLLIKAASLIENITKLEDLKKIKYKEFDIGSAVFSSLVDQTLNTKPCIKENRDKILKLFADGLNAFEKFNEWLKLNLPDHVFIFNGRFSVARALVRSCEQNNISFSTHERTGNLNKIQLFPFGFPHDPRRYPRMAKELFDKKDTIPNFIQEGINFFEERPKGHLTGWHSFILNQKSGQLPVDFDKSRRNVALLGSSESEALATEGMFQDFKYPTQYEVYLSFLKLVQKKLPSLFFYLRLHPNSKDELNKWWECDEFKKITNLKIIEPESEISSYALLAACEKSVGLASTLCIEATYWGKPSIILGPTYYSGFDAVYEPKTLDEACELVADVSLPAKPKDNAIMFGSFLRCYGDELPYSKPVNFYTLDFKGKVPEARREVQEWLGECEKRPPVSGVEKWLQDRKDRLDFKRLWRECNGWFAEKTQLVSYAQNNEDILLWRAFKHVEKGFYIDVGAKHPVDNSVTKLFYENGWSGINIEPVPEKLEELKKDRPRDINLGSLVGSNSGSILFYEIPDDTRLSTTDEETARRHAAEYGYNIKIHQMNFESLDSICRKNKTQTIHFLKIDVEGCEGEVIASMDFDYVKPWIIIITLTLPCSDECADALWEIKLKNAGYEFVFFDGLSRYYVLSQKLELKKHFSYPTGMHEPFITKKLQDISELNQSLELKNRILDQKISDMSSSLSWKITKPFRKIDKFLKKIHANPFLCK